MQLSPMTFPPYIAQEAGEGRWSRDNKKRHTTMKPDSEGFGSFVSGLRTCCSPSIRVFIAAVAIEAKGRGLRHRVYKTQR